MTALLLAAALAWALAGTAERLGRRRGARRRLARSAGRSVDVTAVLGAAALRAAAAAGWRPGTSPRRAGAVVLAATTVAVHPVLGLVATGGVLAAPVFRRRRERAAADAAAVAALPDTIDLLAVAARAGLPAPAAVVAVAERAPPPWGAALAAVAARCARGDRFADAVDELAALAPPARPGASLRALLRSSVEDGSDLAGGLDRLGADAREVRRRRAEEAARRVPVRLLLPLVACSLPAFALLTIVPIVAGALGALDP